MNAAKAAKVEKVITMKKAILPDTTDEIPESVPLNREEKQYRDIRLKIQTALKSLPNDTKFADLMDALEEEIYEVRRVREPRPITLMPHPSPLTLLGRQMQEVAALGTLDLEPMDRLQQLK